MHPRHRRQEFLRFLRWIDMKVPAEVDMHLVLDNDEIDEHPVGKARLARRERFDLHRVSSFLL